MAVAAVALVAVLAAGIAEAAIPDTNGAIHGCFKKLSGDVRVIDPGAGDACSSSETGLDWNQTGAQGPQGPQGPQGTQGGQGPQGPSGVSAYQVVTALGVTSGSGPAKGQASARCPDGTRVVGGGFQVPPSADVSVQRNLASISVFGDEWQVSVWGDGGIVFVAFAVCVDKQQLTGG